MLTQSLGFFSGYFAATAFPYTGYFVIHAALTDALSPTFLQSPLSSKCFAVVSIMPHPRVVSGDVLPLFYWLFLLGRMLGRCCLVFSQWMLCHHSYIYFVGSFRIVVFLAAHDPLLNAYFSVVFY